MQSAHKSPHSVFWIGLDTPECPARPSPRLNSTFDSGPLQSINAPLGKELKPLPKGTLIPADFTPN
jgi:hypothetical protein